MTMDWQQLAVWLIVGWAVGYIGTLGWKAMRARSGGGCGPTGCGTCPSSKADSEAEPASIVSIGSIPKRNGRPTASSGARSR